MTEGAEFELDLDSGAALLAGSLDQADYWEFEQPWPKGGRWG
jgi:hypothetical protein